MVPPPGGAQGFDVRDQVVDDAIGVHGIAVETREHRPPSSDAVTSDTSEYGSVSDAKRAERDAVLDDASDESVPQGDRLLCSITQLGVSVVGFDRGVHDRAAARDRGLPGRMQTPGSCA